MTAFLKRANTTNGKLATQMTSKRGNADSEFPAILNTTANRKEKEKATGADQSPQTLSLINFMRFAMLLASRIRYPCIRLNERGEAAYTAPLYTIFCIQ